ncbi:MAG: glutamine-hydrolyzing GMP synthase [bacterium]|nr:glutamine-hydrolyzing GMP synthase [bacterium]
MAYHSSNNLILIFDFGSQTCHLIKRRLRDLGVDAKLVDPEIKIGQIKKLNPAGLIFSGGPASVYQKDAPAVDKDIFNLDIPILAICYGWQLIAHLLKGKVVSGRQEYGPHKLKLKNQNSKILQGAKPQFTVWLSHADTVVDLPQGFKIIGSTSQVKAAFVINPDKRIFGVQFHPEVEHTQFGTRIIKNFAHLICGLKIKPKTIDIDQIIQKIKTQVGHHKVVCAVSGGVDSTITALLIGKAIGRQLYPVYIESGLMRLGTKEEVEHIFKEFIKIKPIIVQAQDIFLSKLKGVSDPEKKRKIIGHLYIKLFEKEAKRIKGVKFLAQGTIYSDVIESKGSKRSSKIKSHHNVGGLPKKLGLKLIEPLREFYKDEVKKIGRKLGLPPEVTNKQPFPGPGQAIRIIGSITKQRLAKQQQADKIVLEEIKKAGLYDQVFQSFPIMTGIKSTAVKGDARVYGEVVGLRIYDSSNIMTASWSRLPYDILQKISTRIVNEVPGISRVVYDITTKPPATMEWE